MVGRAALLFALLAQGMAMASPVSFVRCARMNGEQRLELSSTGCDCCGCKSPGHQSSCSSHQHSDSHHHDGNACPGDSEAPVSEVGCSGSCCIHSAIEPTPQVRGRTASDLAELAADVAAYTVADAVAVDLEPSHDFRAFVSRPQKSPHLIATRVIVLRV
jgi:hypothetical protein